MFFARHLRFSELEVMVDGYENGFDDIEESRIKRLFLRKLDKPKDYEGNYEESTVMAEKRKSNIGNLNYKFLIKL